MENSIFRSEGTSVPIESEFQTMHPLLSWRSVLAGLLIAFFCMAGLIGLGMAFGGIGMDQDTSAKSVGIFSGVWFVASVLISIFFGSYFAARVSKFKTGRIGSAQGLVIAALFLGFFFYQIISAIGFAGQATGSIIAKTTGIAGSGVEKMANNPQVGSVIENALGDLNLRSEPKQVASEVATRLIRGDGEGAKNYLARQAGITPGEADQRIAQLKLQVDESINKIKAATATALESTGWTIFLLVILGALASVLGGSLGSVINFRKPLAKRDFIGQEVQV